MQIRAATLNDLEQLVLLLKESHEKLVEATEHTFLTENLKENKSDIFVAVDNKTQNIIGFIQAYRGRSTLFRSSYSIISDIYVAKPYKESTIESALIHYVENITRHFGDARIELQVLNTNQQKQTLFEKNHYLKEEFFTYVKYINHNPVLPNTSNTIKIKQASINDLNELLTLLKEYLEFYHVLYDGNFDKDFLAENLRENKSTIFIALDDNNKIIGFTQLYLNRCSEYKENYYILYDLFVNCKHRNKGIATLLLQATEKYVHHQGLHYIELQTAHENKTAQRLYQKHGYQLKNIVSYYKDFPKDKLTVSCNSNSLIVLSATQAQQQIWRDVQATPKTLKYNMSWCWKITSSIKPEVFENAWRQLVTSLPSLHTCFKLRDNKLFQIIDCQITPRFEIRHFNDADEQQIMQYILTKTQHCFDLGKAPLCLAYIFISSKNIYFGMTFHHIVLDGHSIPLIMKYYSEFYQATNNFDITVQIIHKQLACKYIAQENNQFLVLEKSKAKQFWLDYLTNVPKKINFQSEQLTQTQNQRRCIDFTISSELFAHMKFFAKNHHTTQFIIMTASFAMLLYHYTHQPQFIIGYPFGRRPAGFENLIGYHVNLLPLRITLARDKSFSDLLKEIVTHREEIKNNGFDHYPYQDMVKNLKLFPLNNSVLFNVILSPTSFGKLKLPDINMNEVALDTAENLTDLMLFYEANKCGFEYNIKLFSEKVICQYIKDFEIIMQHFIQHPEHSLDQIELSVISNAQQHVAKV